MLDRPDGAELLAIARRTLLDAVLPALPDTRRYDALMIANALAIAIREQQVGDEFMRQDLESVFRLYGMEKERESTSEEMAAALETLDRRLAAEIRSGAWDAPGRREAARLRLLDVAVRRVRLSNPKYLKSAGIE